MQPHEKTYEENWKEIIEPNGVLDMDALKRELHDYWTCMDHVSQVYCHITGNRISKINTMADVVIQEADEYYERLKAEQAVPPPIKPCPECQSPKRIDNGLACSSCGSDIPTTDH